MNYTAKHLLRISLSLMIVIPPVHARAYSKVGAIVGESAPEQNPDKYCSIFFSDNSTSVEQQEVEKLQDVIRTVKENPETKITLKAFASPYGTESYNKTLCEKRLNKVKDYLLSNGVQLNRP